MCDEKPSHRQVFHRQFIGEIPLKICFSLGSKPSLDSAFIAFTMFCYCQGVEACYCTSCTAGYQKQQCAFLQFTVRHPYRLYQLTGSFFEQAIARQMSFAQTIAAFTACAVTVAATGE
jgi:hypothetical protein